MVKESWLSRVWRVRRSSSEEKSSIGVLAFEVSSLMSRVVSLCQSLGNDQIARLRDDVLNLEGVRKLVSDDDDYLAALALAEICENLSFVACSVGRLGKRCCDRVLRGLDAVFDDLAKNGSAASGAYKWGFGWKNMGTKTKKMERYVARCAILYQEMESLAETEHNLRRLQQSSSENSRTQTSLLEMQQKVIWQRQTVKHIQESSLWNRTFDFAVRLLARSLVTILERIEYVFGLDHSKIAAARGSFLSDSRALNFPPHRTSVSALLRSSVHPTEGNNLPRFASGPLQKSEIRTKSLFASGPLGRSSYDTKSDNKNRGKLDAIYTRSGLLRLKKKRFGGCVIGVAENISPTGSLKVVEIGDPRSNASVLGRLKAATDLDFTSYASILKCNLPLFRCKYQLMSHPPPLSLGAAALAVHYANVIILIEKFSTSPHFITPEARDNLYNMLPTSIKAELRMKLKSYAKNLNSNAYDAALAAEWTDALGRILEWLAPLAHNTLRWQSERTFEQQHLVSKTNVLLLQTLHFANQEKTEAAITELLLGLNYVYRFHEVHDKATLQATRSIGFSEYMDAIG